MHDVEGMIQDIEREIEATRGYIGRSHFAPAVMDAMRRVPRHEFVPDAMRRMAYHDGPVPIDYGQTVSQPYIVALMTDLLDPEPQDVILEVGTGSGYQAAVLSLLVQRVYSTEKIEGLAEQAQERLQRLGYANVETRMCDGYFGWPEHAPYDGIIVTAAAPHVPQPLVDQLKPGANLVIPVGSPFYGQELLVVSKRADGELEMRDLLGVAFVPLTGSGHERPAHLPSEPRR